MIQNVGKEITALNTNDKPKLNFRTEGFVIAGVTLLGYVAAYRYEVGIASYWDIPKSLIEVTLVSVVGATFAVFFFLGLLVFYINPAVMVFGHVLVGEDSTVRRVVLMHLAFAAALVGCLFVFGWDPPVLIGLLTFVIFADSFSLFVPWLWMRFIAKEGDGFFDRVYRFWNDSTEGPDSYQVMSKLTGIRHGWLIFSILSVLAFYPLAWGAGYREAKSETEFLADDDADLALVRRYGSIYAFRAFIRDDEENQFCGDVVLIAESEISGRRLQERKILSKKKEWLEECAEPPKPASSSTAPASLVPSE